MRAILRRTQPGAGAQETLSYGDGQVVIDEGAHRVVVHGEPAPLTHTEWLLLTTLAGSPGRVFSRYELINRTRGYEFEGYERTVDAHVHNLRQKIEADPARPSIVQTVIGAGYRFTPTRDRSR